MQTFRNPIDLDDEGNFRFVIVNKETGKIDEPVTRCLGNFDNYVVVGTLIIDKEVETYTFIQTENIEQKIITITRNDKLKYPSEFNKLLPYSSEELNKECIKRAKDLIFSF